MGQLHRMWSGTNNPADQGRAKSIKNISNEFQVEVTGKNHTVSSRIWRHMNEWGSALGQQQLKGHDKVSCCCSVLIWLSATAWTAAHQASLSIAISRSLLRLKSTESVMPSNHLVLCCSLLLLPSIFLSIRVFSNEAARAIRWPKDWSFSFSICLSSKYSGLISFRTDWFEGLRKVVILFFQTF